jgi:acetyl-CoA carboxylase biotin carboxyl carrier protein
MGFQLGDIRKVLAAFDTSDWDEIHISSEGNELHLISVDAAQRGVAAPAPARSAPVATAAAAAPATVAKSAAVADAVQATPPKASAVDGVGVRAPSVGVFYRAPSPGAPPFVEVGDLVQADTTVCILEVMKLMNPIAAGIAGTVVAIHVANADMVEKDQTLLTIAPAG